MNAFFPRMNAPARVPLGVVVLALGTLGAFLYSVREVLTPFIMAAIFAYLLNPLVTFLEIRGVHRDKAVLVLFIALVGVTTALSYWGLVALWQDIPDLRNSWPDYMRRAEEAMRRVQEILEFHWPVLKRANVLERAIGDAMAWVQRHLWHSPTLVTTVVYVVASLLLAPFVTFFFLRGGSRAAQMALDACPGSWVERFLSLASKIDEVIGNYTRGILWEAFWVGVCSVIGLYMMGLNYAALIGIAAGVGNMIPYFGPVLGVILGIVVALFQFSNLAGPVQVVLVFLIVHYIDGYVLQPLIMRRSVNLNPVTVVFALLAGMRLAGVWGLIFAVPVACLIKESAVVVHDWYRAERGLIPVSKDLQLAAAKPWVV